MLIRIQSYKLSFWNLICHFSRVYFNVLAVFGSYIWLLHLVVTLQCFIQGAVFIIEFHFFFSPIADSFLSCFSTHPSYHANLMHINFFFVTQNYAPILIRKEPFFPTPRVQQSYEYTASKPAHLLPSYDASIRTRVRIRIRTHGYGDRYHVKFC